MRVALAGAGGIGQHILDAIVRTNKYDVVVLSRSDRPDITKRHPSVEIRVVDYNSPESLQQALRDVHTCISTIAAFDESFVTSQRALIEACSVVGVQRFMPSEFEGPPSRRPDSMDFQRWKNTILTYLRTHYPRNSGKLKWSSICNGIFHDYYSPNLESSPYLQAIGFTFLIDLESCSASIPRGADERVARVLFTAADDVGKFTAAALELEEWPEQMRIPATGVSLPDLLAIGERIRGRKFEVKERSIGELEEEFRKAEAKNDFVGMFAAQSELAVARGEFDSEGAAEEIGDKSTTINLLEKFPQLEAVGLEPFLEKWWKKP